MFTIKQQPKQVATEKVDTLIGAGTTVEGNVAATGTIRIDGRVIGEVVTESDIIIGETGQIHGMVKGRNITIGGLLEGNANADGTLHIVATGRVNGDILVESLIVEDGAKYKGSCQMKSDAKEAE
jgi:cytoskeletal protein CcmA (bactofilin family)